MNLSIYEYEYVKIEVYHDEVSPPIVLDMFDATCAIETTRALVKLGYDAYSDYGEMFPDVHRNALQCALELRDFATLQRLAATYNPWMLGG
jgi:hypothetical protein